MTTDRAAEVCFPARLRILRQRLLQRLRRPARAALLVTNPADVHYLTGFTGGDSWLLVPLGAEEGGRGAKPQAYSRARASGGAKTSGDSGDSGGSGGSGGGGVYLLSDFRYAEQIRRQSPQVAAIIRKKGFGEELAKLHSRLKLKKILLQRGDATLGQRRMLVKHLGAAGIGDCEDGLLDQRAVKDDAELQLIRQAIDLQQRAFLKMRRQLKPGMSETQAAALLEFHLRDFGADGCSFDTIVAAGANASKPHAFPSPQARLKRGQMIQFDWGAKVGGYCSDLSRMVTLGAASRKLREIYGIVLEAQLAAIEAVRPGAAFKAIDAAARNVIRKAGYAGQFGHGTGHGIGLDIHEHPVVSFRGTEVAKPGQVITIEPGIYLPGVGGVRIEDDVLVTEGGVGHEVLSDLPKSFESTIIG